MIRQHKLQNVLLDEPPEEVQLADSGDERLHTARLKHDAFTTAERIKQSLRVRIQFALVVEIDKEMLAGMGERGVRLFGIVGDEIVDQTQADGAGSL